MIDPKELRIGSRIKRAIKTDCGIYYEEFTCTEDFLEVLFAARDYENYEPIPLTPEILEQCGFEQTANAKDDSLVFSNNFFVIDLHSSEMCLENSWAETLCIEIKYLHQLQNLYYALTKEELTINHTAPSQLH